MCRVRRRPFPQDCQIPLMAIELQQEKDSSFCVHLQQFEGPLDVLLHLIRERELDIYDIPIAEVTDQYLGFLRQMREMDLNIAGEFLVMAATLIEIKSNYLLPKPPAPEAEEGPDPRDELVQRLLEYEKFKEVASLLRGNEEDRQLLYSRTVAIDPDELPSVPSGLVSTLDLLTALKRVLEDVGEGRAPITTVPRQKLTLRLKMSELYQRLKSAGGQIRFSEIFSGERTRSEVVVTFLALLELIRLCKVVALQPDPFGDILLSEYQELREQ